MCIWLEEFGVVNGHLKSTETALISVAPLAGRHPTKQKVTGSIPDQGTSLGLDPPPVRAFPRGNQSMFLSLSFSLLSPFFKNK